MKKMFMAVIALMMTISASAQFYIYFSDGTVAKVDSISMLAPSDDSGTMNGHEYVDLGLSVKWATYNVGATKPEEYGEYFAWGETQPKSSYKWNTYKWCNGSYNTLTKYCTEESYGTVDNKAILEATDDVATVIWGGNWRTPTKAELEELLDYCTWNWITLNGVDGYKIISNKEGYRDKCIFLPAAGAANSSTGDFCGFWSSSLSIIPDDACMLFFSSSQGKLRIDYRSRCYGYSVRPVCP